MNRLVCILALGLLLQSCATPQSRRTGSLPRGDRGPGDLPARVVGTNGGKALVEFRFRNAGATAVYLAGRFNSWTFQFTTGTGDKPISLVRGADGAWTARVALAPGRWPYCYNIVGGPDDRRFLRDLTNPLRQQECFSCDGYNSVLFIREDLTLSFDKTEARSD